MTELRDRLKRLPEAISSKRRFLLWRHEWNEKRKRLVKTPYYVSGRKRFGDLDSPKDLNRLTDLKSALAALAASQDTNPYDGIGYALVAKDGIGAFDLDKCLTPEGDLLPSHAGRYLAERAEAEGAYIEVSPSGQGLRILGPSSDPTAYSKNGLEYWGEGRYVTLTGSVWANPKGWKDLSHLRETLPTRDQKEKVYDAEEDSLVTNRVVEELRSALSSMSSDERSLWISMGMALKTIGDRGKELWLDWSATSDKFDEDDAEVTWDSFRPGHTSYKSVFAEAQKNWNWENPRAGKADAQDDKEPEDLLDLAIDLGTRKLHPTEFVLDGFLPTGVSLVAGAWGAGKSTNLVPLFASVAHLAPDTWGFRPVLRRHVVWITEAPDQARDTIYSLSEAEGSAEWEEFKEWFHLIPAYRSKPKTLAASIKQAVERLTYTQEGRTFQVRPVVVLDTVSANIDLLNESDNSEVGEVMSRLKEALPGVPLVLIGHTPKAIVKGDVTEMSFRGAGAWEADAVATYYLVHDPETSMRFLAIGKVRFTPDYQEVSFGSEGGRELVATEWGDPQSKAYMHGVPCKSTGEERKAAQMKVKEERKEKAAEQGRAAKMAKTIEGISSLVGRAELVTRNRIMDEVGLRSNDAADVFRALLEGDLVKEVPIPEDVMEVAFKNKRGKKPETVVLPIGVEIDAYFDRFMSVWV